MNNHDPLRAARGILHWSFVGLAVWIALFALTGCSLVAPYENTTVRTMERTWLTMHAVDTYQTTQFDGCTVEGNPLAVKVYGSERPSDTRVIATNAVLGYAHYRIGGWIDQRTERAAVDPDDTSYGGWYLFRAAWHGFALIGTGYAVLHNATRDYECNR